MKVRSKRKTLLFLVLKKVLNIRTIVMLIVILAANTYAWFIYATKVETTITARVRSWNIVFQTHDEPIVEYLTFEVTDVYPGMETFYDTVDVYNEGDGFAQITYEIESVQILFDTYTSGVYTSGEMKQIISQNYPFAIDMGITDTVITPNGGEQTFRIAVGWPYESGNDALDTYWGGQAYSFNEYSPGSSNIIITVKLEVIQIIDADTEHS